MTWKINMISKKKMTQRPLYLYEYKLRLAILIQNLLPTPSCLDIFKKFYNSISGLFVAVFSTEYSKFGRKPNNSLELVTG